MIDHSAYDTAPTTDLAAAIELAETLAQSIVPSHGDALLAHREYLQSKAEAGRAAIVAQRKLDATFTGSSVVIDQRADRSFTAIALRLRAAILQVHDLAVAHEAQQILDRLFGSDGLEFLKLPYPSQLTQMKVRMVPIDGDSQGQGKEPGLAERIDAIAGPLYLANIRARIGEYDEMVHNKSTTVVSPESLLPHLQTLRTAITHFATLAIATVRLANPDTEVAARALLAPIDNARAAAAALAKKRPEAATPVAGPPATPTGAADA